MGETKVLDRTDYSGKQQMDFKSHAIESPEQPMCCSFSPCASLLATGLIDGKILLHSYATPASESSIKLQYEISAPPEEGREEEEEEEEEPSCRVLEFLNNGKWLLAGSANKSISFYDVDTAKLVQRMEGAHDSGISAAFCPLRDSPNIVATGDEEGVIKIWDLRVNSSSQKNKGCLVTYSGHEDFISSFAIHTKEKCLIAASGDGTLSVHDLRTNKMKLRTEEDADDEILSVAVVKEGKKIIAGTQSGVLNIYSWGAMKDCSDRFPGHPESVDALIKFDEDTVLTGSSDGCIRIVNVLPNKLIGVVGVHSSAEDLPIECLSLSHDKKLLASVSHDHIVKLWDLALLLEDDDIGEDPEGEIKGEGEEMELELPKATEKKVKQIAKKTSAPLKGKTAKTEEILQKEDSDDNEEEEEEVMGKKKKQKTEKTKWTKSNERKAEDNFFSGLL